jgi:hypothetical protein
MTEAWSNMYTPVAYTYDAAMHCASCADKKFNGELDAATGDDGEQVAALYSWDLACKESCIDCGSVLSRRCLNCSDCDMWITGLEESVRHGNASARKMINKIRRINLYKEENNGSTY